METTPPDEYELLLALAGPRPMTFFLQAFVTLFVIIDPPGIVPLFLGLTRGRSVRTRRRLAWQAAVVAFSVIVAFALFGRVILNYTQVQIAALEGAGGLLLLLVSLQLLTGKTEEPTSSERAKTNVAFVPLGTPLLAGPGAIVATMLYVQRIHHPLNVVALALAIAGVARGGLAVDAVRRGHPPRSHRQRRRAADQDRRPAAVRHRRPAGSRIRPRLRRPSQIIRAIQVIEWPRAIWVGARVGRSVAEVRSWTLGWSGCGQRRLRSRTSHAIGAECNGWLIGDDDEVIVIDPGEDAEAVFERSGSARSSP